MHRILLKRKHLKRDIQTIESGTALGAGGREFESRRPDQLIQSVIGKPKASEKRCTRKCTRGSDFVPYCTLVEASAGRVSVCCGSYDEMDSTALRFARFRM
jgi:hypothetical protein